MSTIVHRQTLQVLHSVNTPDYSADDWVIAPDLSAVANVPAEYWKLSGDDIVEMSTAEKTAVDGELLQTARDSRKEALEHEFEQQIRTRYPSHQREALLSILTAAIAVSRVNQAAYVRQLQTWIEDGIRTHLHPGQDAVDAAPDLASVAAVDLELDDWLAADPLITVRQALSIED